MTTETLDKIYLEYSQLTQARTARELHMEAVAKSLTEDVRLRDQEILRLKLIIEEKERTA